MSKFKEKILEFLKKGNNTKIKLLILLLVSIMVSACLDIFVFKAVYGFISFDRFIILFGAIYFIGLHFILNLSDMYKFIYKKRYILALLLLLFIVLMGYSGSSISNYNKVIQPNISEDSYKTILGSARAIRSDEWAVNTPLSFSQNKSQNRLSYFNLNIRGTETDMFTIINAPVLDITSIGKLFNLGYLFGNRVGLSFWWYGRLIALLLVSFELCMIISKKNKFISFVGALLITFSPAVQWWYSNFIADILIIGNLAIVLIDKFILSKKNWIKYICLVGIAILSVSYVFVFYPAWLIPFGYVYLALFIYIIIKNKKEFKFNKKDLIVIIIAIVAVLLVFFRYYTLSHDTINAVLNTDYPGQRFELGGNGKETLFSYAYGMYLPYFQMDNPCEVSSMISLFPIPMLVAIIYFITSKNKKEHYKFIIPMMIVSILLSIWCLIPTNSIFAKLTFLYMSPAKRVAIPLGFVQILLMIYLIANVKEEENIMSKKFGIILSFILSSIVMMIVLKTAPQNFIGPFKAYISGIMLLFLFFFLFTINILESKKYLSYCLIILSILSGICVNPIIKGTDVIYDKPLSKAIQKIVTEDPDALWIVENDNISVANYVAANGTKIINSTNYYPNFELMEKIFDDEAFEEELRKIYNRYAHVIINVTNEEKTNLELVSLDVIKIDISTDKLKELGVKYICAIRDLEEFSDEYVDFEEVYYEDGYYIYMLNY